MNDELKTGCAQCADTPGWRWTMADGVRRTLRCECRSRAKEAEDKKHPGGFRPLAEVMERSPAVKAVITEQDRRVAELIEKCKGAANAVTSAEIAGALWPATSMDPKQWEKLRRIVTDSVARLRTLARIPIAASKSKPYGYFIPVEASEFDEMHERIYNEAMKLLDWDTLFNRNTALVRELEGQLGLETQSLVAQSCEATLRPESGNEPQSSPPGGGQLCATGEEMAR